MHGGHVHSDQLPDAGESLDVGRPQQGIQRESTPA
jgi:hypothetical protein